MGHGTDYGSYFITTYIKMQTTWRRKEKEKKKKEKKEREKKRNQNNLKVVQLCNIISKRECTTVKFKEEHKMHNIIPFWIPILVVSFAIIKNMLPCLNRIFIT